MTKYKHMRRKKYNLRKTAILLVSVFAMVLMVIGASLSFLKTQKGPLVNEFASSYVTSEVVETFKDNIKKDVKIQNTGDIDAYIRAAVIVTWKDKSGNVYPKMPVAGTDYTIVFSDSRWDRETTDGYYYYTEPVDSKGYTEVLINEVKPVDSKTPEGYILSVEILGDAIQSLPTKAVESSWNVTVDTNGHISK